MTVINDFQVNGLFPSTIGTVGTAKVYFPRLLGTSIGVESVAPSPSSAKGQLVVPGNGTLDGVNFSVLVGGSVTGGAGAASTNVAITLEANTGTEASPSYTVLATIAAVALNPVADGVAENFLLKVDLFGTTASGVVSGTQQAILSTTRVAAAALTNSLSGINMKAANPFGLVVGVTFSVGTGTAVPNVASLTQFQIAAA